MADLTITTTSVKKEAGADVDHGTAGETIAAGKAVYFDETTDKYMLSDSNSATAAARTSIGVALNGAANNQTIAVATKGPITIGATLTPGVAYYLSDTPGGICPVADVGSGEYSTVMGLATSASVLDLKIASSGVAL